MTTIRDLTDPICWYGPEGFGLELPRGCVGFVVRYWPAGARGIGELVIDDDTGGPLLLPARLTQQEFCTSLVGRVGRYRLAPIDAGRRPLGERFAMMSITAAMAERARLLAACFESAALADAAVQVAAASARMAAVVTTARRDLAEMRRQFGDVCDEVITQLVELRAKIERGEVVAPWPWLSSSSAGQGLPS